MKIKIHTPELHPSAGRGSDPKVSISRKTGTVTLNKGTIELMGLSETSKVSLVQDEEHPTDWYLMKDPNGFAIRQASQSKSMMFNNSSLVKSIFSSLNSLDNSLSIKVDEKAVMHEACKLYPLATKLVMKQVQSTNRMTV